MLYITVIRKMPIKTTISQHFTCTRRAVRKREWNMLVHTVPRTQDNNSSQTECFPSMQRLGKGRKRRQEISNGKVGGEFQFSYIVGRIV